MDDAKDSAHPDSVAYLLHPLWRRALLPAFVVMGFALPLTFLTWVEQYLYYLRPVELVPTYATAWLMLAAIAVPLSILAALASKGLERAKWPLRYLLNVALFWIAAFTAIAAILYATVIWVQTFGGLEGFPYRHPLTIGSAVFASFFAVTAAGRRALLGLSRFAAISTLLGACTLPALWLSPWHPGSVPQRPAADATRRAMPNILLVTVDTLSAQHMSLYGAARNTTPRLAAFAAHATVFDRAYANGNFTTPGISSILTGTRPWIHRTFLPLTWPVEAARHDSLPAILKRAGYETAYVSTNVLAGASRLGLAPYFDVRITDRVPAHTLCRDGLSAAFPYECAAAQSPLFLFAQKNIDALDRELPSSRKNLYFDPRLATQPALDWLAATGRRRPVFLWVHLVPPHAPYAAPAPWIGTFDPSPEARHEADSDTVTVYPFARLPASRVRTLEARYDESVLYVDHYLGAFLDSASKLLGENTVEIVTADHGESFEHGYGSHTGPGLYESIIHIPLLIKLPFQMHGLRSPVPVQQIDLAPTLAALVGLAAPSLWEGRSLLPDLRASPGAADASTRPVFTMSFEQNPRRGRLRTGSVAVIEGRWKLIDYLGTLHYPDMPALHDELYDVFADPGETRNRISGEPRESEHLRDLIAAELARHGGPLP